jgi:glutathione S-transferase
VSLVIYGSPQNRTSRCLWALEELEVPYEHVPINTTGDNRTPEYLAINPNGHVPTLKHDDFCLYESMAINLYLARTFGKGSLQPDTEREAALAVQWSFWVMTECERHLLTAVFHALGLAGHEKSDANAQELLKELDAPLKVLDAHSRRHEWLVGNRFTIADLNVASVLAWALASKLDLSGYPHLSAWLKRCFERPSRKRTDGISKTFIRAL